jgi:hypothetical protein
MKVNFFESELTRIQERFNQSFGSQSICDLQTRAQVIIAIVHMGLLTHNILKAEDRSMVRQDIQMFIRIKGVLTSLFSQVEK